MCYILFPYAPSKKTGYNVLGIENVITIKDYLQFLHVCFIFSFQPETVLKVQLP